ncbi:Base plate wedge protein 53 [Caballeronia sp. J97]|uniref:Base plate wedge protein 53 n=1 Tax=Caballeronia sp. J97 TaxID=2805429 RepID=UPI002AB01F4C|nr:Base plate wedge protein 53 [Caballeronia sp. J97]
MTTDPVQLLIEAGAIPSNPFGADSRYQGVALGAHVARPGEPGRPYVLRRFIPQRRAITVAVEHIVTSGERPDLLGAAALGNALLYWRIADANAVLDPFELTDTPGRRVAIPLPVGL